VVERGGKESRHRVADFEDLNADAVDSGPAPLSAQTDECDS
jgi:hypothetical protein